MYDAVIVIPMNVCVLAFMNPLGAFLVRKVNPKILIAMGSCLGVLAMVLNASASTF